MKYMKNLKISFFLLTFLLVSSLSFANIWIDEDFTDGQAFDATALDPFHEAVLTTPISFSANTGAISSDKAWDSTVSSYSYKLEAGQALSVDAGAYDAPTNGAMQYLQFAVNIGEIPAAGTMAEFRWNWVLGTADPTYSFYVQFVSNGSSVDLLAGEDTTTSTSGTIATLSNTTDWVYVTIQIQKNNGTVDDNDATRNIAQTGIARGAYFYASNTTAGFTVPIADGSGTVDASQDWSLAVSSGSLYIGDFYWEGGIDPANWPYCAGCEAAENVRALDNPTDVEDWDGLF